MTSTGRYLPGDYNKHEPEMDWIGRMGSITLYSQFSLSGSRLLSSPDIIHKINPSVLERTFHVTSTSVMSIIKEGRSDSIPNYTKIEMTMKWHNLHFVFIPTFLPQYVMENLGVSYHKRFIIKSQKNSRYDSLLQTSTRHILI